MCLKKIFILSAILLSNFFVFAQENSDSNNKSPKANKTNIKGLLKGTDAPYFEDDQFLSAGISGGLSSVYFKSDLSDRKRGGGGTFTVDYNKFFTNNWGISAGLGLGLSNSNACLDDTSTYRLKDIINNQEFDYKVVFTGWEEHQRCLNIEIPVGALYRFAINNKISLLGGAGFKLCTPIKTKYWKKEGTVETIGGYDKYGAGTNLSNLPHHGFELDDPSPKGKISTKGIGLSLYYDVNAIFHIKGLDLFAGIYSSIGLTDLGKNHDGMVKDLDGNFSSVMNSEMVDKMNLRNLGLRCGIKVPFTLLLGSEPKNSSTK